VESGIAASGADRPLRLRVFDGNLEREVELTADRLVLVGPPVPAQGARELARELKVPVDADGWFLEAHPKLRPVDFASDGLFLAGTAHYPKFLDEAMAQAAAAAGRAARLLIAPERVASPVVACVDPQLCAACLTCVRACPFGVPRIVTEAGDAGGVRHTAWIEPVLCQGCGICVSECPADAITLMHFRKPQIRAEVGALLEEVAV
jgi:heterodisulfide reductase subunit A-like polyferredoxin